MFISHVCGMNKPQAWDMETTDVGYSSHKRGLWTRSLVEACFRGKGAHPNAFRGIEDGGMRFL